MVNKIIFAGLLLIFWSGFLGAQQITEVRPEVKDDRVLVHYVITGGSFTDRFSVALFVSRDGGNTFEGPLKEVAGDTGKNVQRGSHTIQWDALKEMPFVDESLVFDVRGQKQPVKKSFFISYVGNPVTWLGLRAGMLAKVGFYVEFRANQDAFRKSSFTWKDGSITDYYPAGYYEFTGNNGYSAFSILGGVNWQVIPDLFVYGGFGYGKENYLMQINQFSYNTSASFSQAYVKYDGYFTSGLEIDAGLMYRVKWLLFSAGVTTISFSSFNWTAGAGITF